MGLRRALAMVSAAALLSACERDETPPSPRSAIRHLVVIIQENHSFDAYFGRYCTAPTGSAPACTDGPACCERGPEVDPKGASPIVLDDDANLTFDPDHHRDCETFEIDGGAMDGYTTPTRGAPDGCGDPRNFAYASGDVVAAYHGLADTYALADRYFQPIVGASTANDLFFARAGFGFDDNDFAPLAIGRTCIFGPSAPVRQLVGPTIGDLLSQAHVGWRFYSEGYADAVTHAAAGDCAKAAPLCEAGFDGYPCIYDPSDDPFSYSASAADDPEHVTDYSMFGVHAKAGTLPPVSFVKGLGYRSEHPGSSISRGVGFVREVLDAVRASPLAHETLVLVAWDESGGFFDHVAPPPPSAFDGAPYGPRVPLLAIGDFARKHTVSHVVMEHASIVKLIEWNWLGGTGQLHRRDMLVNNLGSLLDPRATGVAVPED